jgi:hypothetical protein
MIPVIIMRDHGFFFRCSAENDRATATHFSNRITLARANRIIARGHCMSRNWFDDPADHEASRMIGPVGSANEGLKELNARATARLFARHSRQIYNTKYRKASAFAKKSTVRRQPIGA